MRALGGRRIRSSYARPTALSRRSGATAFRLSLRSSTRKPMGTRPKVAATRLAWMRGDVLWRSLHLTDASGRRRKRKDLSAEHRPWPARFLQHCRDACAVRVQASSGWPWPQRLSLRAYGHLGTVPETVGKRETLAFAGAATIVGTLASRMPADAARPKWAARFRPTGVSPRRAAGKLLRHVCAHHWAPGGRLPRYPRNHRSRTESGRHAIPRFANSETASRSYRACWIDSESKKGRRPRPRPMSWR